MLNPPDNLIYLWYTLSGQAHQNLITDGNILFMPPL